MILAAAAVAETAVGAKAEGLVLHLLLQLVVILAATRAVVYAVRRFGQTDVSGEILAGLLLGPSALGAIAPHLTERLWDPSTSTIFVGIAQIGLVLLMFQIGLEFEFGTKLRASKRAVAIVSLAGLCAPFALGFTSAAWFYAQLPDPRPPLLGFRLFFAIAMSITAIPILGRIFMELGLSRTRIAALTIGAAAIDDVAGWLLLGVVTLFVRQEFSLRWLALRLGLLTLFVAFVIFALRPLLKTAIARHMKKFTTLQPGFIAFILLVLFAAASITSLLGIFAIFGGFIVGAALHDDRAFVAQWKAHVAPLVTTLFLPVFFACTGLRTNVLGLTTAAQWIICALVIAVAFVSKFGGAYVGARLAGEDNRTALTVGVCMNTRALMELVVINIGYDLGVLPKSIFTMLVIMAIASTFVTAPLIRRLLVRARPQTQPLTTSLALDPELHF